MIDPVLYPTHPRPRKGDWQHTHSGRRVWPFDPRLGDVVIEDIAQALARDNRWGGAIIPWWYSVAQHSVLVSQEVAETNPELALVGLLHDAAEYVIRDLPRPFKAGLIEYKAIEQEWELVIGDTFGLGDKLLHMSPVVKRADMVVCSTEARDIVTPGNAKERWGSSGYLPRVERIKAWEPRQAYDEFMWWFERLYRMHTSPEAE